MQVSLVNLGKREGAFRVAAVSGLTTGIAANAPVFSMRWNPASSPYQEGMVRFCVIQRLRAKWRTITGFTAAQEIGLAAYVARSFTVADSGGTALTLTTTNAQKRTGVPPGTAGVTTGGMPTTQATINIATTGTLTAGTRTLDAQPFAEEVFADLAAAATVPKGRFEAEFVNQDQPGFPLVLSPQEGIVIQNVIAQGAAGTARIIVEVDWLEVARVVGG